LPFLPLFDGVFGVRSSQTPHSSRVTGIGNLTFRVMGGKSGKIAARNGKEVAMDGKFGGKNGNVLRDAVALHTCEPALALP
jgi:hypothetical protein